MPPPHPPWGDAALPGAAGSPGSLGGVSRANGRAWPRAPDTSSHVSGHAGAVQGHTGVHHGESRHLQGFLEDVCGVPCLLPAV